MPVHYSAAFKEVEANRDYILKMLQGLIRINTSAPPGRNYDKLVSLLETEFNRFGFWTERVVVPQAYLKKIPFELEGDRINLAAFKNSSGNNETVTTYAHMDVGPPGEPGPGEPPWICDPFEGRLHGGNFYGRGALDMKGSIASLMGALKVMNDLELTPNYNMRCLFCTDEELGVYPGVQYLAERDYVQGHLLNLELGAQAPVLLKAYQGFIWLDIIATGKSRQGAVASAGTNVLEEIVPILNELLKLKKALRKKFSKIPTFALLNPSSPYLTPALSLSEIQSGVGTMFLPVDCTVRVGRRTIPEETFNFVVNEIKTLVQKVKSKNQLTIDVEIVPTEIYPAIEFEVDNPYMQKMKQARIAVHGGDPAYWLGGNVGDFIEGGFPALTDSASVKKIIPDIKFTGVSGVTVNNLTFHQINERIEISALLSMTKELVHYLAF